MKKLYLSSISGVIATFLFVLPSFAHVIVTPKTVGIGAYQEFSMSVSSEKDNPTVALRLMIPAGLQSVTPNVKAGWTIDEKKNGTGEGAMVTEIDWAGGSIPSEQRDTFQLQAQVPPKETTLQWKAVQVYQSGETVEWIHNPSKDPEDDSAPPPYSETKIINDLQNTFDSQKAEDGEGEGIQKSSVAFSLIALALSAIALTISLRKNR